MSLTNFESMHCSKCGKNTTHEVTTFNDLIHLPKYKCLKCKKEDKNGRRTS
jgi:DNA-directed RNA polymerase subunit RPC12/RpoP